MNKIKLNFSKQISFLLILLLSSGCGANNTTFSNSSKNIKDTYFQKNTFISGKVEFPEFKTKATSSDLTNNTAVSLIYSSDYPDISKQNVTIGVGLANSTGNFNISPPLNFVPQNNDVFVLEARKRLGSTGKNILTLKTHIKWENNSWKSITSDKILINNKTTAISIISDIQKDLLSSSSTFNIIDKDGNILFNKINGNPTKNIAYGKLIVPNGNGISTLSDENGTVLSSFYLNTNLSDIKFSPDGSKILFKSYEGNGYQLYTVNPDGTERKNVTNFTTSTIPSYPSWSSNSKKIMFTSNSGTITIINSDGTGKYTIAPNINSIDNPTWTPDGTKIVFVNNYNIKIMNSDGTNIKSITNFPYINNANYNMRPGLSLDGKKIVFYYNETYKWSLYTVNIDGTGLKKLLDSVYSDYWGSSFPARWSPDGTKIAFLYNNANTGSSNASLGVVNSDGTNPKNFGFTGYEANFNTTWTSDGLAILYCASLGIMKVFPDGTNNKILYSSSTFDWIFTEFKNAEDIDTNVILKVADLVTQSLTKEKDPVANISLSQIGYILK